MSPSTEGCYACLNVLREMLPLLGPLAPVVRNVHDALQLCLLSDEHFSDSLALPGSGEGGGASPRGSTPRSRRLGSARAEQRSPTSTHTRVPYFVLVRKLEEAAAALRLERDTALEEVSRNNADLTNLDEQLIAAKGQLQVKTATIDKLVREHAALESELVQAREQTRKEEAKYEILQTECATLTREFLSNTMHLEEELDRLRAQAAIREDA